MKPWDLSDEECKKKSMAEIKEHFKTTEPEKRGMSYTLYLL
jgi:hypothetical protein